jgi:Protein of unknown function (DUF3617)
MKMFFVAFTIVAVTAPSVFAATSIVGTWDFPDQDCASPIRISAMAMVSEDVNCRFTSVKRKGDTVTWKGNCDGAEGSSQETVTARLSKKGRLTISYAPGGNVLANLKRCK